MKKKILYIAIFVAVLVGVLLLIQEPEDPGLIIDAWPVENDEYPTNEYEAVPLDFSSNLEAEQYRAELTAAYEELPNFARHYNIALWGCGASCQSFMIMDNTTGQIYGVYTTEELARGKMSAGIDFSLSSNTITIKGTDKSFKWKNNELNPITN